MDNDLSFFFQLMDEINKFDCPKIYLEEGKLIVSANKNGINMEHYDGLLGGNYSGRTYIEQKDGTLKATLWMSFGNYCAPEKPVECMDRINRGLIKIKNEKETVDETR